MSRSVVLTLALGGCYFAPSFDGARDAGGDDGDGGDATLACSTKPSARGIQSEIAANGRFTVSMRDSDMQIAFADEISRYPMPVSIRLGGNEVAAGVGSPPGCFNEDQIGIAVFPGYSIAGNQMPSPPHALMRGATGPALVSVTVSWGFQGPCSVNPHQGAGTSSFAMFPDGRIVRNDTIWPNVTPAAKPVDECTCAAGVEHYLITTYTSLRGVTELTQNDGVDGNALIPEPPDGDPDPPHPNPTVQYADRICAALDDSARRIAFRWHDFRNTPAPGATPSRVRWTTSGHAFVYDGVNSNQMMTSLPSVPVSANPPIALQTTMLLQGGAMPSSGSSAMCSDLNARLAGYAVSTPINIGGLGVVPSDAGMYEDWFDGTRDHTAPFTIEANAGALGPGFAIRTRIPGFTAIATNRDEDRVIWQRDEDDVFTIWFEDGLTAQEPITVTPECPI